MSGTFPTTVPTDLPSESERINENLFAGSKITSSRIQLETTAEEVLYKCLGMRRSITGSIRQSHKDFAKAASKAQRIFKVTAGFCDELGLTLKCPDFPSVPPSGNHANTQLVMEATAKSWCHQLAKQFRSDRVGRVTVLSNDAVRFDFFEVSTEYGIWSHAKNRVKSTQELTHAKLIKLPAEHLPMPAKADRMVKSLMKVPELARHCRILTGMKTSTKSAVQDEWREDTRFAKGMKATGKAIANNSKAIGVGAAAAGGVAFAAMTLPAILVGTGAAAVTAAAVPVALADPAICLGDVVFYGWD